MTKFELVKRLVARDCIQEKIIGDAVKKILEYMATTLSSRERIEIRGFGSFSIHYRTPRTGRNPRTGDVVKLEGRYVPHFKPGKTLRNRVNKIYITNKIF